MSRLSCSRRCLWGLGAPAGRGRIQGEDRPGIFLWDQHQWEPWHLGRARVQCSVSLLAGSSSLCKLTCRTQKPGRLWDSLPWEMTWQEKTLPPCSSEGRVIPADMRPVPPATHCPGEMSVRRPCCITGRDPCGHHARCLECSGRWLTICWLTWGGGCGVPCQGRRASVPVPVDQVTAARGHRFSGRCAPTCIISSRNCHSLRASLCFGNRAMVSGQEGELCRGLCGPPRDICCIESLERAGGGHGGTEDGPQCDSTSARCHLPSAPACRALSQPPVFRCFTPAAAEATPAAVPVLPLACRRAGVQPQHGTSCSWVSLGSVPRSTPHLRSFTWDWHGSPCPGGDTGRSWRTSLKHSAEGRPCGQGGPCPHRGPHQLPLCCPG
uniref:Uncharacterized protein n=1 Tax=Mustela putorius furo TaxID=9669 RepID=M3Z812_MUSPF